MSLSAAQLVHIDGSRRIDVAENAIDAAHEGDLKSSAAN
jgi:hypothetical protein